MITLYFRDAFYVCWTWPVLEFWMLFPSVQLSVVALLDYCGQILVLVRLVFQSGATLGLSEVRPGICQSHQSAKLQGAFSVLSPEKFSFMGGACSQNNCLSLSTAGAAV